MNKQNRILILASVMSAAAVSCVEINNDYDLDKDVDMTLNVGGDFGIPVGSTKLLKLGDLIPEDMEGLNISRTGDYAIHYANDFNWSLSVSEFHVNAYKGPKDEFSFSAVIPSVDYVSIAPVPFRVINTVNYHQDNIAEEISEIQTISGELQLYLNFSISQKSSIFSNAVLLKGTEIILPEFVHIKTVSSGAASVTGSSTITFKEDITVPSDGTIFSLAVTVDSMDFTKLPSDQGVTSPGHINLNIPVSFEGQLCFMKKHQIASGSIADVTIAFEAGSTSIQIDEVTGKVNISEEVELEPVDIELGADFVDLKNARLDFANPRIDVQSMNDFPVGAEVNMKITTSSEGKTVSTLALGSRNGTPAIAVPSGELAKYWISPYSDFPGGYTGIKVDNLGKLFLTFPDRIELNEMSVQSLNDIVTFVPGKDYNIDLKVYLDMPLAFGTQLYIPAEVSLDQLLELDDVSFQHAEITATILNMIPLGLEISGNLEDSEGNVAKDVRMDIDCKVAPGSAESPSSSDFKLVIKSDEVIRTIEGLKLKLALNCSDPSYAGICLNKNQGIKLDNVKLHVYDGITIDLN